MTCEGFRFRRAGQAGSCGPEVTRMEPARGGGGGAPPRPPAPGDKRRPAQCEGPRLPKQGLSEAAAAARLRALPAQHDHGYSGNGLRFPPP